MKFPVAVVALVAAGLLVCALAAGRGAPERFNIAREALLYQGDKIAYQTAVLHWTAVIQRQGSTRSYQELLAFAASLSAAKAHEVAHVFGEALYKKEGLAAIGICDEQLFYGCWHQFVGQSLANEGFSILPELKQLCAYSEKPASCAHGVGHGILGHLGYTHEALVEALALCKQIEARHPRNGCTEGVFMEYNLQELAGTVALNAPRRLHAANVYEPCSAVDSAYASPCGFELPVWWTAAKGTLLKPEPLAEWMGIRCAGAPLDNLRQGCFQGIGFSAGLNYGAAMAAKLCERAATTTRASEVLCLAGAASALPVWSRNALTQSCAAVGLEGAAHEYCLAYGRAEEVKKDSVPLQY